MNTAANWFIQQKLQQAQSGFSTAMSRMRQARTLRELMQASNVHVESFVHCLVRSEQSRAERLREELATKMVDAHLKEIEALPFDQRRERISNYMRLDWCFLRGHEPRLYRRTEMESIRLTHKPPQPPAS